jgi:hypothetical protein
MFPAPNPALVNFAHSGFVNDWRWDDEGTLGAHAFIRATKCFYLSEGSADRAVRIAIH